jgi:RsiW-degrading membrane proteinase PrsW (M82 family)
MNSSATVKATPGIRGAGAVAIVILIIGTSAWAAVELRDHLRLPITVGGSSWTVITAVTWIVYGTLLVLILRRPIKLAHLSGIGILLAIAWGGLASIEIAGRANDAMSLLAFNHDPSASATWPTWLAAPVIEETIKTLGFLLLAVLPISRRFGPVAGLATGMLVGLSFQIMENFVYTLNQIMNHPDAPLGAFLGIGFMRGLVGAFSHLVYSGVIGAAIGWSMTRGSRGTFRAVALVVGAWVAMVFLHMWGNWSTSHDALLSYLINAAVSLVVLIVVYRRSMRSEGSRAEEIRER